MENDEIISRRRNVVLVAQRRGQGLDQVKKPVTAGRNMRAVLDVTRRPEALGGSVVALVEKGIERAQDGLDVAVIATWLGLCGHGISPFRDKCGRLHLPTRYSNDAPVRFSETSQSFAAVAASRAWGMISAGA